VSDEIVISINADASGAIPSLEEITAVLNKVNTELAEAGAAGAAAGEEITEGMTIATVATGKFENTLAMAVGRVVGMEAGVGMLGGVFGRLGAAAGLAGPLIIAALPLAAIAGAISLYNSYQESIITVLNDQSKLNDMFGKENDALMAQQERLTGLTQGPLAEYAAKLADIARESTSLSAVQGALTKKLEDETHWWETAIAAAEKYGKALGQNSLDEALPWKSYNKQDAELFIAKITEATKANGDLAAASVNVGRELVNIHNIEQSQPIGSYLRLQTEEARKALQDYYQYIQDQIAKTSGQKKLIGTESTVKQDQDAIALQKEKTSGLIGEINARKEIADIVAATNEKLAAPTQVLNEADVQRQKDAAISAASAVRDAAITAANQTYDAKKAELDKEITLAHGDTGKIADLQQQELNLAKTRDEAVAKADADMQSKRVSAETDADARIAKLREDLAARQQELAEKSTNDAADNQLRADDEEIRNIEREAAAHKISRTQEINDLKSIQEQIRANEATALAAIQAEIAADAELRSSGKFGPEGSEGYQASLARQDAAQQKLNQLQQQYNSELDQTNAKLNQLDTSWSTWAQKQVSQMPTLNQQLQTMATTFENGLSNAVAKSIVQGKDFGQMMTKVFQQMEEAMIEYFVQWAIKTEGQIALQAVLDVLTGGGAAAGGGGAAASSFAFSLRGGGIIPSAAGGMFTPANGPSSGSLALLHPNEMVLPSPISQKIQDMTNGGESGGSGGRGGDIHIHAMDADSFRAFLKKNPGALGAGVTHAAKNGHLDVNSIARGK
jgi:hypothetical protein